MEDIHFLSRLERVSNPQVELLLSLYRDPDLVRHLLDGVALPEGASRVAIALEHEENSPLAIVTRDGKFVTCLGQGMGAPNLPLVTRARLDSACARMEDLRNRLAASQKLAEEDSNNLLLRLLEAGDALSREELSALALWGPLAGPQLAEILIKTSSLLEDIRIRAARRDYARAYDRKHLLRHWSLTCGVGHLLTVLSIWGEQPWMKQFYELKGDKLGFFFSSGVAQDVTPVVARALWSINRVGKLLLPVYKRAFLENQSQTIINQSQAFLALLILGVGHSKLEAEVKKALSRSWSRATGKDGEELPPVRGDKVGVVGDCFERPEKLRSYQRSVGVTRALEIARRLPKNSPYHFETQEDVPEELAMMLALYRPGEYLGVGSRAIGGLMASLPWLTRAKAEDLYPTKDFLQATYQPPSQEKLQRLLQRCSEYYKESPIQVERKPGRNEPCLCGSGKKYKKCCG